MEDLALRLARFNPARHYMQVVMCRPLPLYPQEQQFLPKETSLLKLSLPPSATSATVFATPSGLTGFKAGVAALIALNTSVHVSFNTSVANTNYCVTINPACFGSAPTSTLVVTNLATNGFDIVIGAGGTAISNIAIAWVVWPFNNP